MIHIDHYAYQSRLKDIEPRHKLLFTMSLLGACVLFSSPWVSVAVIAVMTGYTVGGGGIPLSFYLRLMQLPMAFLGIGILTILINVFPDPRGVLVAIPLSSGWLGISSASLMLAANLFLKALGATACLYALSLTTPMVALLSAFGRLGLPALIAELMGLVYRFIFVLMETAASIMTAQHARLGYTAPGVAYRSFGTMLTMLLVRALKRSDDLYIALESRGYQGELAVLEEPYQKSPKLLAATLLVNCILAALWYATR